MKRFDDIPIGQRIKYIRTESNLSQKELADRLGVSSALVGQYERGIRKPKFDSLLKIANALETELLDLLKYSDYADIPPLSDDLKSVVASQYNDVHEKALFRIIKHLSALPFAELNELANMIEKHVPIDFYEYTRICFWQMMNGHSPHDTNEVLMHHDWHKSKS